VTPDGKRAVSASHDQTLRVWDLAKGSLLHSLQGHTARVTVVAVTPDGTRAVSASDDKTVKVWDLAKGSLLRSLQGHTDLVNAVSVTPDGKLAISASSDQALKVWDLANGDLVATFAADYPVFRFTTSPSGQILVAGDASGQVHLLRIEGPGSGT
jgi:WD40 repeat protein